MPRRKPDPVSCSIPGHEDREATHLGRLSDPWGSLPRPYCTECAEGITEWVSKHWRAVRMEVVAL